VPEKKTSASSRRRNRARSIFKLVNSMKLALRLASSYFYCKIEQTDENVDELTVMYEHSHCLFVAFCKDYHDRLLKWAQTVKIGNRFGDSSINLLF